jgi:hypothetical protein
MSVPGQLYSYLSMLADFKTLGKPMVACRVGNLGLGIVSLGIDAFETGIASLSFFSESTLLEDRPINYAMRIKYYMPELLANLQLEPALDILTSGQHNSMICRCPFCGGRTDDSLRRGSKEHFLWHRMREMEAINRLKSSERLNVFLKKTEQALKLAVDIRRKLGVAIPSNHFKTWLEVFPEVARRM